MSYTRVETIGDATLYMSDLLDVLPLIPIADLCLIDPPYGLKEAAGKNNSRGSAQGANKWKGTRNTTGAGVPSTYFPADAWDNCPLNNERLQAIIKAAKNHIIWGGNYYALPPSSKWLVWDKENGTTDFADCELAWTNLPGAVRIFKHMWNGMLRASEKSIPRVHPTQKPVALMEWCLHQAGNIKSVIDPCMGSAPVGIACAKLGIKYTGIENNERHFQTACERIYNAYRQSRMFA